MDGKGGVERIRNAFQNASKTSGFNKFVSVLIIVILYAAYVMHKYGLSNGVEITLLTWCFFVFGTPVADAGGLVAFPVRVFTNNPMYNTQLWVYLVATVITGYYAVFHKDKFAFTVVGRILYKMVTQPLSLYGVIIVVSLVGTLISAYLEDSVYSYLVYRENKNKGGIALDVAVFVAMWAIYIAVIYHLGIQNVYASATTTTAKALAASRAGR
jgi:hypothetical protein